MDKLPVITRSRPDWLSTVVNNRQEFSSVGFFSDSQHPDASVLYVPLLVMGQPHRAVFLQCHRCRGADRLADVLNYQYDDLVFVSAFDVPFSTAADTWVMPVIQFRSMNVHAMGHAVPFSIFSRFMKTSSSTTTASRARRVTGPTDPEIFALLQHEFPWLSQAELDNILNKKKAVGEAGDEDEDGSAPAGGRGSVDVPPDLPEDVLASVADDLSSLREQYAGFDDVASYFTVRVLGGAWSISKRNVPCTDVGSYAIERSTERWCSGVGWPARKSFAVRKHGGVANARALAEEMCRRGNFFMKAWIDAGSVGGFDFQPVKPAYRAPPSYEDWLDSLPVSSDAFKSAMEVRDLCPIRVPL